MVFRPGYLPGMAPPQQLELVSPLAETGGDGRAPGQPGVVGATVSLLTGDCLEQMRLLPDASVDCITTDPPYGLSKEPDVAEVLRHWLAGDDYIHRGGGFMGKSWDSFVPGPAVWREAYRVLKPGGHLLAFFGTRTYDLGTMAVRLAGFEIRDTIAWMYGSGFPKSKNVGLELGYESETALGTALKPAHEPIVVARKPLTGTVARNVLEHGTGAINIDACRITVEDAEYARNHSGDRGHAGTRDKDGEGATNLHAGGGSASSGGRWPANVILDEEAARLLDEQTPRLQPAKGSYRRKGGTTQLFGAMGDGRIDEPNGMVDSGGASRFFYCAKPSKRERHAGLPGAVGTPGTAGVLDPDRDHVQKNVHPTVKPIALMRYLIRLVCPPGGTVLDPFLGSGSTGCAAVQEPCVGRFIGIEREPEYARIAQARIAHWASDQAA